MTPTDTDKLLALCEAATPGEWLARAVRGGWDGVEDSNGEVLLRLVLNNSANADFIAAANPAAVKALILELKKAEAELATAREKALEEAAFCCEELAETTYTDRATHPANALCYAARDIRALAAKGGK